MNALRVLREAAYFYSHNFLRIALLCLPLLLLERLSELALREQFGHWPEGALQLLFGVLFYPLYTGMLILFLDARSQGREASAAELFGRALQLWPGFALLTALTSVLVMLGLSLMLLPGDGEVLEHHVDIHVWTCSEFCCHFACLASLGLVADIMPCIKTL